MAQVVLRASFIEDYDRQADFLVVHADPAWLERLRASIFEAHETVQRFPEAYPIEHRTSRYVVRRIPLGEVPYVVLYVHLPRRPIRRAWFTRLFHHRQERPLPEVTGWPW